MKKWAVISLLILYAANIIAQECKFITNRISGMDGTRLVITQPMMLSNKFNSGTLEVWSTLSGDTAIVMAFVCNINFLMHVKKSDTITLKLENSEEVSIPILQDAASVDGDQKKITIMTMVNDSESSKLKASPVKHIAIPVNLGIMEGAPTSKRQAASIQKAISCVNEYLVTVPKKFS